MKAHLRLAVYAACFALIASPASAGSPDPIGEHLTELNATLQTATMKYDTAELKNLITNDYELVSSSGKVYNRAAFLKDAGDRSVAYEINQPEDVTVRDYNGDCAVVSAILHVRYRAGGKTVDVHIRYGDVWVKQNGQWRYAYGEASPIKH